MAPETIVTAAVKFAVEFELIVFALTFVISLCVLSLGAAACIIKSVLDHVFPNWRTLFERSSRTPTVLGLTSQKSE